MKIASYTIEQLQRMIQRLESFQGTTNQRTWDKRYLRAYRQQLQEKQNESNTWERNHPT